jgi:putative transposase
MSVYSLTVGLVVRRGDRTLEFERRLEDGTIVFTDQLDRAPERFAIGALTRQIADGRLQIVRGERGDPKHGDTVAGRVCDIASLDEKYVHELAGRLSVINALKRRGLRRGMRRAIAQELPTIASSLELTRAPSPSAVMEWWRNLDAAEGNTHGVVNRNAVKAQPRRVIPEVESLVKRTIRMEYCTRERRSIVTVHASVMRQLEILAHSGVLPRDHAKVSVSTVERRVKDIDGYTLDVSRYGPAFAKRKWRESHGGMRATRALERFEIDHTLLDIVVVCDRTGLPLGRPTITVVVDSYSGYVCGFFISFWGTGLAPTMSALKQAILPKDEYTREAFGLESNWLGYGICELLVVDNGLEFHSNQFLRALTLLNTDVRFCAVRQPWLKPVVERAMRSVNSYLPARGKVERRIDNYLPINPDESAAVPFSGLCQGLLKAFVDIHAFEVNERKLARPYDLFEDSFRNIPPPNLMPDLSRLDIIVAPSKEMSVSGEGVVSDFLRYNSTELQALLRQVGGKFRALVKTPHENIGTVHVMDPMAKRWLAVPSCCPEYTEGLSIVQHRAVRSFRREQLKARDAIGMLMRRKAELAAFWAAQVPKRRKRASTLVQRCVGMTSSQVLASVSGTSPVPGTPAPPIVADVELEVPRTPIAAFGSFILD